MATTALLFESPPSGTALVFGAVLAPVDCPVTIDAALPGLQAALSMVPPVDASMDATLPALTSETELLYTSGASRPTVNTTASAWHNGIDARVNVSTPYQRADQTRTGAQTLWQAAAPVAASAAPTWQRAAPTSQGTQSRYQDAARVLQSLLGQYQQALRDLRWPTSGVFERALPAGIARSNHMQDGTRTRRGGTAHYQDASARRKGNSDSGKRAAALRKAWLAHYQDAMRTMPGIWVPPMPPGPTPRVGSPHLLFLDPRGTVHLVFGRATGPVATVVVPVRKVYIVINSASLRRVQGNIVLPVLSMGLSLDVDSWTWQFRAALPASALANIEPDVAGNPVEVEATINGAPYRMLIEKISRSRSFGQASISASGRGLSATLDAPYAPVLNFGNTQQRTAQQLLGDVLTLNNVALPWAVNWQMEDWVVPANIWRHQGSYISALNNVVQAAGGYLQPHASTQSLHALHRYPTAPWAWAGITPDIELPTAVTVQEGIEWTERARYNRVFVSGTTGGIMGQVTRTGADGSQVAPMVTDALITSAIAARRRGIKELASGGRQAMLSLSLPVLPETGIIAPGKMVRYDGRIGITRSVSVTVGMPSINQQIQVETYA